MDSKPVQCEYCKKVFLEYQANCDRCGASLPVPVSEPKSFKSNNHPVVIQDVVEQPASIKKVYPHSAKLSLENTPAENAEAFIARFILAIGLLALGVSLFLLFNPQYLQYLSHAKISLPSPTIQKPVKTSTRAPKVTTIPTARPAVVGDDWSIGKLELYGFRVLLPPGWVLREVNRRPESVKLHGHDCADYEIFDPNAKVKISIFPLCGEGGVMPYTCPSGVVLVSGSNNLFRYPIANQSTYHYVTGHKKGSSYICDDAFILSKGQEFYITTVEFLYLGNHQENKQYFSLVDGIITTLDYP